MDDVEQDQYEFLEAFSVPKALELKMNETQVKFINYFLEAIKEKIIDLALPEVCLRSDDEFFNLIWKKEDDFVDCLFSDDGGYVESWWAINNGTESGGSEHGLEPLTEQLINDIVEKLKLFHV